MPPLKLAHRYLEIFYGEGELDELSALFAPDLIFRGPFLECASAEAYLDTLREDPPRGMSFRILREFENENSACVIYRFKKGNVETTMAQIFECEDQVIRSIELIFDATAFA